MYLLFNNSLIPLLFLIISVSGCSTLPNSHSTLEMANVKGLQFSKELKYVPFYAQEKYQCGPATLAMALNDAGVEVKPDDLVDQVFIPARKGSLQVEMLTSTRRHGLIAYELAPDLSDLLKEIDGGTPVIVLENNSFGFNKNWHYSTVIGYDLKEKIIIRRSGLNARETLPMNFFEFLWKSGGNWAMIAIPPDRLPATVTLERYTKAVLALEKSGQINAARVAYGTMIKRWPNSLAGQMGLGNTAYEMKDFNEAENAFFKATQDHPFAVAAFNNLAQVYIKLEKLDLALSSAKHAVNLGGPLESKAKETLEEVVQQLTILNSR